MSKVKLRVEKLWVRYIASVSPTLNALFVVSVLMIILHDFVLVGNPELFEGGAELWDLMYRLSLALVGSYIFYFLVVHLKRQKDKENLLPFLERQTTRIAANARSLAQSLKSESGYELEGDYPSLADTQIMCAAINLYDAAPFQIGNQQGYSQGNWLQYMHYFRNHTKGTIVSIYATMPFLDSDYLKLLINVEDCSYFGVLDGITGLPLNNSPLSFLDTQLQEYFEHVKALEEYASKKLVW